ncbi:LEPR-XLL domain-containing protein, partial [Coraliomargarita sp. SDUM461004]
MSSHHTPSFRVEALEQRILLSAVPMDGGLADYQDDDFSSATTLFEEYSEQGSVSDSLSEGSDVLGLDSDGALFAGAMPLDNNFDEAVLEENQDESEVLDDASRDASRDDLVENEASEDTANASEDAFDDSSTVFAASSISSSEDSLTEEVESDASVAESSETATEFAAITAEFDANDQPIEPTIVASGANSMLDQQQVTLTLGQGPPAEENTTANLHNALNSSDLDQNEISPVAESDQLPVSLLNHVYPDFSSLNPAHHPILTLSPSDLGATIGIGDGATGDFVLSNADIDFLSRFERVIIGSQNAHHSFHIGNPELADSEITFNFSLSLISPQTGGEVYQHSNIVVGEGHSFEIIGSKNSTHLSGTTTVAGDLTYDDSVILDGDVILNVGGNFNLAATGYVLGNDDGVADSLTITADGNIFIGGDIGGADFHDLTLNASGSLVIDSTVTISTRALTTGADAITGVSIADSGDITLVGTSIEVESGARLLSHVETGSTFEFGDLVLEAEQSVLSDLARNAAGAATPAVLLDGVVIHTGAVSIIASSDPENPVAGIGSVTLDQVIERITDLIYNFDAAIQAQTLSFEVVGLSLSALDVVSLQGDFAFSKTGTSYIQALAVNVNANLGTGPVSVGLKEGALGLVMTENGFALEASGAVHFEGGAIAAVSAEAVTLRINQTGAEWTSHLIEIDTSSYTIAQLAASTDLLSVNVAGFEATLLDSVYLRGNFAFGADGVLNTLSAVGSDIEGGLVVGAYTVGVEEASFGLFFDATGKLALEAEGSIFSDLPGDITLGADSVLLKVNETSQDMTGEVLLVGGDNYTFSELPAANPDTLIELLVAGAHLSAFGFFEISGDFAFTRSTADVLLDNSDEVAVDTLLIGSNDLSAFVGLNPDTEDAIGFGLSGVSLAMAILTDRVDATRSWTSLQMTATAAAFSGIDGVTISTNELSVAVNTASADGRLVDYVSRGLEIKTGASTDMTFDMDASAGELMQASGTLNVELFEFFSVSGDFALNKSSSTITLSDAGATQLSVDQLTLGGSHLTAFAGLAAGSSDASGFQLTDLNFALGIFSDQTDQARSWSALQATAGSFEFVGVDGLSVAGSSLSVAISQASMGDEVVDFAVDPITIATGPSSSRDLDLDGSRGALLEVSGDVDIDVYGFVALTGGFAFAKSEATVPVYLNEATGDVAVELLTIGASDVSA